METSFTLRNPPSTYLRINTTQTHTPKTLAPALDEITMRTYLDAALTQYLGLTGTAISIDILKVEKGQAWLKLPAEDEMLVVAAFAQWTGSGGIVLRVMGRSCWLGGLVDGEKGDERLWSLE